jgi:hypothetical protein
MFKNCVRLRLRKIMVLCRVDIQSKETTFFAAKLESRFERRRRGVGEEGTLPITVEERD